MNWPLKQRRRAVDYRTPWGLVSFWGLEEASGTRNDSHGTNHLTDNNTVTQAVGKVGNAGQFTRANSEYLSIADNASLSGGNVDFWSAAWVYLDSKSGVRGFWSKWNSTGNQRERDVYYDNGDDRIHAFVSSDGAGGASATEVIASNFGSPPVSTWIFVCFWHDAVNDTISLAINDGTPNSVAHSTGVFNGTAAFELGTNATNANHMDGRIDQACFGKSPANGIAAEIATIRSVLYNGGSGQSYAGISG